MHGISGVSVVVLHRAQRLIISSQLAFLQALPTRVIEIDEARGGNVTAPYNDLSWALQNVYVGETTWDTLRTPGGEWIRLTGPYVYDPLWVGIDHVPEITNHTVSWSGLPGCPTGRPIPENCTDMSCDWWCNSTLPSASIMAPVFTYHWNGTDNEAEGVRTNVTVSNISNIYPLNRAEFHLASAPTSCLF